MQLQFEQQTVRCLRQAVRKTDQQEATQEIRLEDEMPDIGGVIGCWGQVLIRNKQWRGTDMQIGGGVLAWVLYRPEDDSMPQWVNGWIPFQADFGFPQAEKDGVIRVLPCVYAMDARATGARKLMVRAQIQLCVEALVGEEQTVYQPPREIGDVQLLQRTYPVLMRTEAGEKSFVLEDELNLPASCPAVEKILSFSLQPELIDKKVLADKVVFRGSANLHMVYQGQDGLLRCWDFDIPFSQYTELDHDYEQDTDVDFWMAVTSLELEQAEEGRLRLKAGLAGQYVLFQRHMLNMVEDAYIPGKTTKLQIQTMDVPAVLDFDSTTVTLQQDVDGEMIQPADVLVQPSQPVCRREGDMLSAELNAKVQVLFYDREGRLQCTHSNWQTTHQIPCNEKCDMQLQLMLSGKPQLPNGAPQVKADMRLDWRTWAGQGLTMVSSLQAEEKPAAVRPSLILCTMTEEDLWTVAKQCDSTVKAIEEANHLTQPPQLGELLLIPVMV